MYICIIRSIDKYFIISYVFTNILFIYLYYILLLFIYLCIVI